MIEVISYITTLAFLLLISFYLVNSVDEAYHLGLRKWVKRSLSTLVSIILIGVLFLLAKCGGGGYEYSPTGESTLEHYEPR